MNNNVKDLKSYCVLGGKSSDNSIKIRINLVHILWTNSSQYFSKKENNFKEI